MDDSNGTNPPDRTLGYRNGERVLVVDVGWSGPTHQMVRAQAAHAGLQVDVIGANLNSPDPTGPEAPGSRTSDPETSTDNRRRTLVWPPVH